MTWFFRASIAALVVFLAGVLVLVHACMSSGWDSIGEFVYGLLISAGGLVAAAVCSFISAVWNPPRRRASIAMGIASLLLLGGLYLFAKSA